jgi:nitrate reductase gamma subunit
MSLDTWIDWASGPLFRLSLAICLLGLFYHVVATLQLVFVARSRAAIRDWSLIQIARRTAAWLAPWRIVTQRPLYGTASLLFHAAVLLVPLFYVGHVGLLGTWWPAWWPTLAPLAADVLTWLGIIGLVVLLGSRLVITRSRDLTRFADAAILAALLVTLLSGYWSAHPSSSPVFSPRTMVLAHMLLGDLILLLLPFSKMVHVVLYPFSQLLSEIGWRFPAASGRHVAIALGKENEPV